MSMNLTRDQEMALCLEMLKVYAQGVMDALNKSEYASAALATQRLMDRAEHTYRKLGYGDAIT